MAHQGTAERLKRVVYFPQINATVKEVIARCQPCITKHKTKKPQKHTLFTNLPPYPFHTIHVDFVGPIYKSSKGNQYILTVKDAFSRWVEAFPLKEATAANAAKCLEENIFPRFGLPVKIHSDCGSQFTSAFWQEMGKQLHMKITVTTPYNPKSNGCVERFHRDLSKMLAAVNEGGEADWEDGLPAALMAIRSAKSNTTGLTPYSVLFGREMSLPLDLLFALPDMSTEHFTDAREKAFTIKKKIQRAYTYALIHAQKAVERQRREYKRDKQYFTVGHKVWLYTPKTFTTGPTKLKSRWSGPWTVCAPPGNELMIRISPSAGWQLKHSIVVSIDRLELYTKGPPIEPETGDDLQATGDEFAESIEPESCIWQQEHSINMDNFKQILPHTLGTDSGFEESDTDETSPNHDPQPDIAKVHPPSTVQGHSDSAKLDNTIISDNTEQATVPDQTVDHQKPESNKPVVIAFPQPLAYIVDTPRKRRRKPKIYH